MPLQADSEWRLAQGGRVFFGWVGGRRRVSCVLPEGFLHMRGIKTGEVGRKFRVSATYDGPELESSSRSMKLLFAEVV